VSPNIGDILSGLSESITEVTSTDETIIPIPPNTYVINITVVGGGGGGSGHRTVPIIEYDGGTGGGASSVITGLIYSNNFDNYDMVKVKNGKGGAAGASGIVNDMSNRGGTGEISSVWLYKSSNGNQLLIFKATYGYGGTGLGGAPGSDENDYINTGVVVNPYTTKGNAGSHGQTINNKPGGSGGGNTLGIGGIGSHYDYDNGITINATNGTKGSGGGGGMRYGDGTQTAPPGSGGDGYTKLEFGIAL